MKDKVTFTAEEIKSAYAVRQAILEDDAPEMKSIYMAGEIVMWDEMRKASENQPQGKEGWISVKERLPEGGFEVIVAVGGKTSRYLHRYWVQTKMWIRQDTANDIETKVTHWQPLPPAPTTP